MPYGTLPFHRLFFRQLYSDAFLEANRRALSALEKMGTPQECRRFVIGAEAIRKFDVYDDLLKITCPVLVLGVKGDPVVSGEASREIADAIGCDCYMYEGYRHGFFDEAPDFPDRLYRFFI